MQCALIIGFSGIVDHGKGHKGSPKTLVENFKSGALNHSANGFPIRLMSERFCKPLRSGRKWPDRNGGELQNHIRNINGLAQKPIGYRYTHSKFFLIISNT